MGEARRVVNRIIQSVDRASNVIRRIRGLSKKATSEMARLDVNEVIEETVPLVRSQAISQRVTLRLMSRQSGRERRGNQDERRQP